MLCPNCNEKPISFFNWAKGLKWYRTECQHCGAELKCNTATTISFIFEIPLTVIPAITFNRRYPGMGDFMPFIIVVSIALIIGAIVWFTCAGYDLVDNGDY